MTRDSATSQDVLLWQMQSAPSPWPWLGCLSPSGLMGRAVHPPTDSREGQGLTPLTGHASSPGLPFPQMTLYLSHLAMDYVLSLMKFLRFLFNIVCILCVVVFLNGSYSPWVYQTISFMYLFPSCLMSTPVSIRVTAHSKSLLRLCLLSSSSETLNRILLIGTKTSPEFYQNFTTNSFRS